MKWKSSFYLVLFITCIGCEQSVLVEDLTKEDALNLAHKLTDSGIRVNREKKSLNSYTLTVSLKDEAQALAIASSFESFSKSEKDLEQYLGSKSFIPEPSSIRKQKELGLRSLLLERTLLALAGVKKVRVSFFPSKEDNKAERVSIVISKDNKSDLKKTDIESIVLNDSRIDPENLTIQISEAKEVLETRRAEGSSRLSPFYFNVSLAEKKTAQLQVFAVVLLSAVLGIIIGLSVSGLKFKRFKR